MAAARPPPACSTSGQGLRAYAGAPQTRSAHDNWSQINLDPSQLVLRAAHHPSLGYLPCMRGMAT